MAMPAWKTSLPFAGLVLAAGMASAQTDVSVEAYFHCAYTLERAAEVVEQPYRAVYLKHAADLAEAALEIDPARWNELATETGAAPADMTRAEIVQAADFCLAHLEPPE